MKLNILTSVDAQFIGRVLIIDELPHAQQNIKQIISFIDDEITRKIN
jgi:hypothetical protein